MSVTPPPRHSKVTVAMAGLFCRHHNSYYKIPKQLHHLHRGCSEIPSFLTTEVRAKNAAWMKTASDRDGGREMRQTQISECILEVKVKHLENKLSGSNKKTFAVSTERNLNIQNFFEQSVEDKMKHVTKVDSYYGWIAVEREKLNPERPGDLKEAVNFNPADDSDDWPDVEFQQTSMDMFQRCTKLSQRVCDALSVGVGLRWCFLRDAHKCAVKKGSATTLRSLYYPPIPEGSPSKPGQIRAGEHSDYGSISLVFQDDIGGLEANIPGTGYVPATPISGTVLVNIGDLLQRWTSDKLLATKHRVVVPENEIGRKKCRQSIVFFFYPDYDYLIKCVDGSDKYDPITGLDYLKYRYSVTF
ncbi:uncharacterized protein LOC128246243 [Mya arenaria]|uniref:uncharacterized protein LOC128246243 n=1 Tax=Mya arenaria TaxID=6604 RepID=UPI0022E66C78|nr:uncharacterized protein LOC128246243 [Mya arenaria]